MPQPQQETLNVSVTIQAMTDVGRVRTHNEDNFIVCPDLGEKRWYVSDQPHPLSSKGCLLVVADGMGGTNAGEVASEIAVETIRRQFDGLPQLENPGEQEAYERLQQAILAAHQDIAEAALANPAHAGMGTTLVVAWVFPHRAFIGWVGDSRAYRYQKEGGLQLLTDDHSLVWEMVKAGTLTPEEADVHPNSNIITQSLGNGSQPPAPEFVSCPLAPGDRLLLCSDGLNNMVSHKVLEKIFGAETAVAATCRELIQWANEEGGADNVTVLCLEVAGTAAKKNFFNLFGLLSL